MAKPFVIEGRDERPAFGYPFRFRLLGENDRVLFSGWSRWDRNPSPLFSFGVERDASVIEYWEGGNWVRVANCGAAAPAAG